ncbi:hypothetical protein GCM10014715_85500 [Streptomyces spiralis]|uniref:Uncharacterized protein n=1 Tax=Streptomyces spiralis TaxID=66376 RepID=A0A919ANK3_9ACTN|nr:hypothetical protein GCM10014715_85500 [Streptomyces spiralis]
MGAPDGSPATMAAACSDTGDVGEPSDSRRDGHAEPATEDHAQWRGQAAVCPLWPSSSHR